MARRKSSPVRTLLNPRNVLIPIAIGLVVAFLLIYRNFDVEAYSKLSWTWTSSLYLFAALLMVITRDLGYMARIRILTNNEISWRKSFDVIMLWEFASAISPSVVGGSGVALFIVNREGISLGRSTAVVMITALLDELFYILMVPIVLLVVGMSNIFPVDLQKEVLGFELGTKQIFFVGYGFIFLLTSIITLAVFVAPVSFKKVLAGAFSIGFLRRWRNSALTTGDEIIETSKQLKGESFGFWLKAFGATFFSWTARFWVVNFIILAFSAAHIGFVDHFLIYARQLVMWVIMLISPTPGSSGVAELAFEGFLADFILPVGLGGSVILVWRLLTYYPYLIAGSVVLPGWIRRVYLGRKLIKFKS